MEERDQDRCRHNASGPGAPFEEALCDHVIDP